MFGRSMCYTLGGRTIELRPLTLNDFTTDMVAGMNDPATIRYTSRYGMRATLNDELAWFKKITDDKESIYWGISINGSPAVGSTAVHSIHHDPYTGIIIWEATARGIGIGTNAHKMRAWYIDRVLNLKRVNSTVRATNVASLLALIRVGYTIWGTEPMVKQIDGEWVDNNHLVWLPPKVYSTSIVKPQYQMGISVARQVLLEMDQAITLN